jgi:carbonic anhydrase/acetyltransferase-like protein (isoleucine patch superfamily)
MAIYALGDVEPTISSEAFIHPDATIIGDVHIGARSSVWPQAVLRGDDGPIYVGERSSIQDGTVVHTVQEHPTTIGNHCTIGHIVHLEGCIIEDHALVGNGSIVLHRAIVRSWALVGANAVVTNDTEVPSGALALGVPAKIRLGAANADMIRMSADSYADRVDVYRRGLRRLD